VYEYNNGGGIHIDGVVAWRLACSMTNLDIVRAGEASEIV